MNGYNEGYRCEGNETLLAIVAILLTFVSAHKSLSMTSRFVREPPWRPVLKSSRLPCFYLLFFYFPKCTMGHFQPKSVKNIDVCKYLIFWSCLGIFKSCFVSHSKCSKLWLKIFFFFFDQSEWNDFYPYFLRLILKSKINAPLCTTGYAGAVGRLLRQTTKDEELCVK